MKLAITIAVIVKAMAMPMSGREKVLKRGKSRVQRKLAAGAEVKGNENQNQILKKVIEDYERNNMKENMN